MGLLSEPLKRLPVFSEICEEIKQERFPISITGCVDSQKGHLLANLAEDASCKLLLTYREEKAAELYEDMCFFDKNTILYPGKDLLFYSADIHSNHTAAGRMRVLSRLLAGEKLTVVAQIGSLMERMVSREDFEKNCLALSLDSVIETEALRIRLVELGYVSSGLATDPGEFSIRGDIIDVFPLTMECPVRIELWGDEVDSIRTFDAESQRSIENLKEIMIYPASEVILPRDKIPRVIRQMQDEYEKQKDAFRKKKDRAAADRLRRMVEAAADELTALGTTTGSESLLSYFYDETVSLLSWLPQDTVIYFDEAPRVLEKAKAEEEEFRMSMDGRVQGGYVLPGQTRLTYTYEETVNHLLGRPLIFLNRLDGTVEFPVEPVCYDINVRSVYSYQGSFDQLSHDLNKWKKDKYQMILMSSSPSRARRLAADLREYDLLAWFSEDREKDLVPGEIMVTAGRLSGGFEYPDIPFVVLTEKDIFKDRTRKRRTRKKAHEGARVHSLAEISPGDYVVHETYGLGIYRGIEQINTDGVLKDYITIEYRDKSELSIPAAQLDLIQKYSAAGERRPKLNRLGGNEWENTKSRVRSQIQIAARDLVALYAQRQAKKGFAFRSDTVWQTEFEELFPYEETEDQLTAIEDTKKDMESSRIMDRLICGDVGYGKTEVAIRAAFKAVMDSKQVVCLVPTTILAQQHYQSFSERMNHYPVNIRMLSRFCTPKEVSQIRKGLKDGTVDIVIGTHKVLSKTIEYKDLGLLIIDEEQRFGVKQKEKIKQLKKDVDVLALSATPIPRTLHMSLAGIRDMSILNVAPVDRRAIQTFVMEYNEEMIREAIKREIARGGQVFYVYNRVSDIEEVAAGVSRLVPEARVEYAHGRMGERQLEGIMFAFIEKEIDVLVSTTIIETGLDISNANTMIIHDAHKFGLAQLYQLRGRVGRSRRTAYAFLMYRKNVILKEEAEKRLKAIREFTDLGSGYRIALRDLEIRGAGNLLGAEQSGHMEAVGYDLYCRMLAEAVRQLSGQAPEEESFETTIDLRLDAGIPASYVPSESQKLDLYRRISTIENEEDYEDLIDELTDRYGDIPRPMIRLMELAMIKAQAHEAGILSVEERGKEIAFTMNPRARVKVEEIDGFLKAYRGKMKIRTDERPVFLFNPGKIMKKELPGVVKDVISGIKGLLES